MQNSTVPLWRYMDLSKFIALLSGKLYFPRVDFLGDKFEATYAPWQYDWQNELLQEMEGVDVNDPSYEEALSYMARYQGNRSYQTEISFRRIVSLVARAGYVSCWHRNDSESAAMWGLYLSAKEGVAIRVDENVLREQVQTSHPSANFVPVRYLETERFPVKAVDPLELLSIKRHSFRHEDEFRVILTHDFPVPSLYGSPTECSAMRDFIRSCQFESPLEIISDSELELRSRPASCSAGESVTIDPQMLIREIVVSPESPGHFEDIVKLLCLKFGVQVPVKKSILTSAPVL